MTALLDAAVGTTFGRFKVESAQPGSQGLGHLVCLDTEGGRRFRLPIGSVFSPASPPPPNLHLIADQLSHLWSAPTSDITSSISSYWYGVLDWRYLVPISATTRWLQSKRIDEVLTMAPANDLLYFGLWETVALTVMSDAHEVNRRRLAWEVWYERWGLLSGGDILVNAVESYMQQGDLSRTERLRVLELVKQKPYPGPEFAENVLLRLCGAMSRDRLQPEEFMGTLQCEHFRLNVTRHEIAQFKAAQVACLAAAGPFATADADMMYFDLVLRMIDIDPPTFNSAPARFGPVDKPDISQFQHGMELVNDDAN